MRRIVASAAIFLAGLSLLGASFAAETPLEEPFQKILAYKMGDDAGPVNAVSTLARDSFTKPEERQQVEKQLLAVLQSPQATPDCKKFVCRELVVVGSTAAVPALAALLRDEDMSHMARYALARIAGPEAGKALRDALDKAKGLPLAGIVSSLGDRRDREAVGALAKLTKSNDAMVAEAAVAALGKMGGDEALTAINGVGEPEGAKLATVALDAKLRCADQFLAEGQKGKARGVYMAISTAAKTTHVRTAALRGLVLTAGADAASVLLRPLLGDDPNMQAAAIGLLREVPGEAATKAFAEPLPKLAPATQVLLIGALADRPDKAAAPAILAAMKNADDKVRAAAATALGNVGDASAVPVLLAAAASPNADEANAARASLTRLSAPGADEAILAALKQADAKGRAELVRCLAARRAAGTVPALISLVDDESEDVRREAFTAIGNLADEKTFPSLVKLLVEAKGDAARHAAERAVVAVAGRLKKEDQRDAALLAAYPGADVAAKGSLLRLFAKFGGAKPLATTREALKDADAQIRDAAIRALSTWPDPEAADALLDIIKTTKDNTHRVLALRGYVRLVALPSDRPAAETLKRCQEAFSLATNAVEKKLVLSAMADVHHPGTIKIIEPYLADAELKAEAEAAIKKIQAAMNAPAKATASHNPDKAGLALDGKPETRWDTGTAMVPGMWYQLEFGMERTFTKIVLECKQSGGDYPRGYEVYVSRDGQNWGKPVATGAGTNPVVEIKLPPSSGRFLRIVQTGKTDGLFWSIHTLEIEAQ
jgi:HEAT repeat protein